MRRRSWPVFFLLVVGSFTGPVWSRICEDTAATARLLEDIRYLSSDELEGRGVGTRGLDRAADYIRDRFQAAGLKPAAPAGDYFQSFDTPNGSELGEPNTIAIRSPDGKSSHLKLGTDFVPLAISGQGQFQAPVAFAGYGITAPKSGYDDFADFDVKGKVVLIMARGPGAQADPHAPADPHAAISPRLMDLKQKVSNATRQGAVALLVVNPGKEDEADRLLEFGQQGDLRTGRIPVAQITRAVADQLLRPAFGKSLRELQAAIDSATKPQSRILTDYVCSGELNVRQKVAAVKNVLGLLPASGPQAASAETIVIGAHYDHLGFGEEGSMAPGTRAIHNGADDNASGTAGLIELARRLAKRDLKRHVILAAFTAEERGLLGSEYYVKNPSVPLGQTVAMINLDMIGRLRNDKLIVEGVGTSKEFRPLIESLSRPLGFNLKPVASGMGPSDQTSFCVNKVPVLFFWTDYHPDYHKPSDDWDKISLDGLDRVVSLVEATVVAVSGMAERPAFVEVPMASSPGGDSGGERAYLGTIPAFGEEVDGVLLSGVTAGAPAELAGLRGGDVIVRIGEHDVHNLQDMQTALENHRPGNRIAITVRRGTTRITYPVTLGRRK